MCNIIFIERNIYIIKRSLNSSCQLIRLQTKVVMKSATESLPYGDRVELSISHPCQCSLVVEPTYKAQCGKR